MTSILSRGITVAAAALLFVACTAAGGRAGMGGTPGCRTEIPANLTARPARWLGSCVNGYANDVGVLRLGARAPYQFFLGRVRDGYLITGVLLPRKGQLMVAQRFDTELGVVSPDGLRPAEIDEVFKTASAGATATARRFRAGGNTASAGVYERMAKEYRHPPWE